MYQTGATPQGKAASWRLEFRGGSLAWQVATSCALLTKMTALILLAPLFHCPGDSTKKRHTQPGY